MDLLKVVRRVFRCATMGLNQLFIFHEPILVQCASGWWKNKSATSGKAGGLR